MPCPECSFLSTDRLIAVLYCTIADVNNKRRTHLGVGEVVEGTLVGSISLWEFIHHQITMPKRAPDFSTGIVDCQNPLKVLGRLFKKNEVHENENESGDRWSNKKTMEISSVLSYG